MNYSSKPNQFTSTGLTNNPHKYNSPLLYCCFTLRSVLGSASCDSYRDNGLIEYKHYLYYYCYLEHSLNDKPNQLLNNFLKRKYPVVKVFQGLDSRRGCNYWLSIEWHAGDQTLIRWSKSSKTCVALAKFVSNVRLVLQQFTLLLCSIFLIETG